jgi:hypothetical protein
MKQLIALSSLTFALLMGCQENPAPTSEAAPSSTPAQGQRMISEIKVGESSVTFYANGKFISFLEKRLPGSPAIIGKEMENLSFAEIHRRLAPGVKVPDELTDAKDVYIPIPEREMPSPTVPEGSHLEPGAAYETPSPLAKATDLNDSWFNTNYCSKIFSQWSGYKACLLNRQGPGNDWGWANATRSAVYVYPHTGTYVHLNGKVDGSGLFDVDLLKGYVYYYYMFSPARWYSFGCRTSLQHYYTISHTSGQFWHWAFGSHTDC